MSIIDKVMKSQDTMLLQFKAPWCKPCQRMEPVMEALEEQLAMQVIELNIDQEDVSQLAQHFKVQTVPCFVIVQAGEMVSAYRSSTDLPTMRKWLKDYLIS